MRLTSQKKMCLNCLNLYSLHQEKMKEFLFHEKKRNFEYHIQISCLHTHTHTPGEKMIDRF